MQILIESQDINLTIQLFDIPVVKRWFIHFQNKVNTDQYYRPANVYVNADGYNNRNLKIDYITDLWKGIHDDIAELKKIGYVFPYDIPQDFNYCQSTLNTLHRFFTYNTLWHHDKGRNPFDHNFTLPLDFLYNDWHKLIDPINNKVHKLEMYTEPTFYRNFVYENFPLSDLHFIPRSMYPDSWFQITPEEYQHNQDFFKYSDNEHLMMLDASILGKSFLQSFCDDDDPTCKDCTGRHGSFGGFFITTDTNRRSIYTSKPFRKWCKKYDIDQTSIPYEFVLGFVKEKSRPLANLEIKSEIKITFQ